MAEGRRTVLLLAVGKRSAPRALVEERPGRSILKSCVDVEGCMECIAEERRYTPYCCRIFTAPNVP